MRNSCGKKRFNISLLVLIFLLVAQLPAAATETSPENEIEQSSAQAIVSRYGEAQLLIKMKKGVKPETLDSLHLKVGGRPFLSASKLGVIRVNVRGSVDSALNIYRASNLIEYAEPNYLRHVAGVIPNDTYYTDQWGLKRIGMEDAWATLGSGAKPVTVAILDTGADTAHEDLKGVFVTDSSQPSLIAGKHFYTDMSGKQASDNNIQDNAGHGTHIAGIIGALTNNTTGVAGIAAGVKILPVKVLDDIGYGDDANIAQGLIWAVDSGARVVNMSLAGPSQSKTLANAVKYAKDKGAVVIAATGNEGASDLNYPAAYDGVIGVGATDSKDLWMHQSNYGSYVDVVAPGVSILSAYPASKSYDGSQYEVNTGTSMAAGFVSGLAAMLLSRTPTLTAGQVEGIIAVTADDLGQAGWDIYYGHGRINAAKAISFGSDSLKPSVAITSPANGAKITGTSLLMTATASDTDSGIAFIDFYVNNERVGSVKSAPYTVTVQSSKLTGLNIIRAIAYDKNGNSSAIETTCYKQSFKDLEPTHWAFQDIESLIERKVLTGYPDGTYKPGNFVGRAEFVKMLIEGLGLSKKTSYSGYFKDVPKTYWAWPYIEAAYDMGLINGYSKTQFAPESRIKRVEMATILIKTGAFTIDYSGASFKDVAVNYWGYIYVMSAKNAGIIGGYPGDVFRPENVMSRAESARVIKTSFFN